MLSNISRCISGCHPGEGFEPLTQYWDWMKGQVFLYDCSICCLFVCDSGEHLFGVVGWGAFSAAALALCHVMFFFKLLLGFSSSKTIGGTISFFPWQKWFTLGIFKRNTQKISFLKNYSWIIWHLITVQRKSVVAFSLVLFPWGIKMRLLTCKILFKHLPSQIPFKTK